MLTKNINFKNFKKKKINQKVPKILSTLLKNQNEVINSFGKSYKNSFTKLQIFKLKKYSNIVIIGMGGSILGAKAIYSFLKNKIKKNFFFKDNLLIE